jgi:general secretion pathway protein G
MRELLNQYYLDQHRYAHSLEDLVQSGYMKGIPVDPITGRNDTWAVERFKGPETGIVNVRSGSSQNSTDGTPYNTW